MAINIQAVRGMNDILPEQSGEWLQLEEILRELLVAYGYREIRFPIVEKTELFKRSIGEVTDIVEKEMYTFEDRNGDSLSLRPEGTACCVRALLEHGLLHYQEQRVWYMGPMFRHERPQKGRYRQFHQLGVEALGLAGPDIDVELILMTARLWRMLKIEDSVVLQLNSLGTNEARQQYRTALVDYFSKQRPKLDEDSQRRLESNPLRILDSKNPEMQDLIQQAPQMLDSLQGESKAHFDYIKHSLEKAGIPYKINPRLVRGLDYYNHTVFEWATDRLGAQGTICAGGRYDGLVELLGGRPTPAIGFAIGLERIIALLAALKEIDTSKNIVDNHKQFPHVYFIMAGEKASEYGLLLAEKWRDVFPTLRLLSHCGGGSFKSQFKKADKSGAEWAFILGEDEVTLGKISVKHLRNLQANESSHLQISMNQVNICEYIENVILNTKDISVKKNIDLSPPPPMQPSTAIQSVRSDEKKNSDNEEQSVHQQNDRHLNK